MPFINLKFDRNNFSISNAEFTSKTLDFSGNISSCLAISVSHSKYENKGYSLLLSWFVAMVLSTFKANQIHPFNFKAQSALFVSRSFQFHWSIDFEFWIEIPLYSQIFQWIERKEQKQFGHIKELELDFYFLYSNHWFSSRSPIQC